MDLFEVLIILAFVGLPLLEGVLKRRRKGGGEPGDAAPRREPGRPSARVPDRAPRPDLDVSGRTSRSPAPGPTTVEGPAADMIPADLWEVLTGERRQPQPVPEAPPDEWVLAGEDAPIEGGSLEGRSLEGESLEAEVGWEASGWERDRWKSESLEAAASERETQHDPGEVVSLEVVPPPPDVRHRLFHAKYDRPEEAAPAPLPGLPHGLAAALKGPGLRRAVLLSEILGPPKGLV